MSVAIEEAGGRDDWQRVMDDSASLHDAILAAGLEDVASYAVAMAYRVRFYMDMNAREAMHVIELRTTPQRHAPYRPIRPPPPRPRARRAPARRARAPGDSRRPGRPPPPAGPPAPPGSGGGGPRPPAPPNPPHRRGCRPGVNRDNWSTNQKSIEPRK